MRALPDRSGTIPLSVEKGGPVPRIAENREPAVPSSPGQRERYRRILRAAAEHGTRQGLERVQMVDVAKDAGVALATLYRYFPSKTILYTSLLHSQVERLDRDTEGVRSGQLPSEAVAGVLIEVGHRLLRTPLLAQAMLQSNNASVASDTSGLEVTHSFANLILRVAGVEDPHDHHYRLVRLIEQTWYGVLISQLNGHIDSEEAEADTWLACRLLLADFDTGVSVSR